MERNLTTGSIPKTIFSFSLPYFLSYFLQTLYGTADLFIIGQFELCRQHHRCLYRQSGHAHAYRHDRRAGYGHHGYDRTCSGRAETAGR